MPAGASLHDEVSGVDRDDIVVVPLGDTPTQVLLDALAGRRHSESRERVLAEERDGLVQRHGTGDLRCLGLSHQLHGTSNLEQAAVREIHRDRVELQHLAQFGFGGRQ